MGAAERRYCDSARPALSLGCAAEVEERNQDRRIVVGIRVSKVLIVSSVAL